MQHRMFGAGPLLDERGGLLETGYALSLVKQYDRAQIRAKKARIKEWDYYLVCSERCALALTVADLGYMGLDSVSLIDFAQPAEKTASRMSLLPLGKKGLPSTSEKGTVRAIGKNYEITFRTEGARRHLYGHMYDFDGADKPLLFDLILHSPKEDSMVIATPFAEKSTAFYYNQKINCMPADGRVIFGGEEYLFAPSASFGVLDWGRGVWTYKNTWYWLSASGIVSGGRFGMNLGYGFGDTSAATENMLFYNGVASKLENVQFHITMKNSREDFLSPWTITDDRDRLRLTFMPIIDRAADTNVLLIRSNQHQVFGRFSGTARLDSGETLVIRDLIGFAEKVFNKW